MHRQIRHFLVSLSWILLFRKRYYVSWRSSCRTLTWSETWQHYISLLLPGKDKRLTGNRRFFLTSCTVKYWLVFLGLGCLDRTLCGISRISLSISTKFLGQWSQIPLVVRFDTMKMMHFHGLSLPPSSFLYFRAQVLKYLSKTNLWVFLLQILTPCSIISKGLQGMQ